MLLPFAASAHGIGLNVGSFIGQGAIHANFNANVGNKEGHGTVTAKKWDNDGDKDDRGVHATTTPVVTNASTTQAQLVKKATRTNAIANFMSSISPAVSARIAGSGLSASSTATANAQLADYNTNVANAKVQANAALTAAGNINANNASTTNDGFVTTAKADLTAAANFLKTAQKDLMSILHAIFNA